MCGKFTAMASWTQATSPSEVRWPEQDSELTFRVMGNLPVIVWDREAGKRRVVPMRWGFPHPSDWRRPQPIHARSETIETTKTFAGAFLEGQRGMVLMKTFNEAPDIEGPTVQHTITPEAGEALAAAFVWRKYDVTAGAPLLAACLITVPANDLISTLLTDRMPAFIDAEDWALWLGEVPGPIDLIKSCLRSVTGVRWKMTREEQKKQGKRGRPTVSNPGGLL